MPDKAAQFPACCYIPQPGCAVNTSGQDCFAVRRESYRANPISMPDKALEFFPGSYIPQPGCAIPTSDDNRSTIRRKRNVLHRTGMSDKDLLSKRLARCDEPSASLDPIGEKQIFGLLSTLARERIILFTTHCYDTIRQAESIVVLMDGKIAEIGTHEELERNAGVFWSLYLKDNATRALHFGSYSGNQVG
jgi:hypothetical protein